MKPKTLFILLAVLIVLFAVGLTLGTRKTDTPNLSPDWIKSLGKLLVPHQPLRAADIQFAQPPDCETALLLGKIQLAEGSSCLWFIESSRAPVRTQPFQLIQGAQARVRLEPVGKDQLTVNQTLDREKPDLELQIFKEGATLELTCRQGTAQRICQFESGPTPAPAPTATRSP